MRIGIDARFFGGKDQGLGRYTESLITHLALLDTVNAYYVFAFPDTDLSGLPANFHVVRTKIRWYGWAEQLLWPALLSRYRLDIMHFTHFNVPLLYRKKFIVTIHDLILLHFPSANVSTRHPWYFKLKYFFYIRVLRHAIYNSIFVITVSEYSRQDILKNFRVSPDKVKTIYLGLSMLDSISERTFESAKMQRPQKYLLYVGNCYPHKNIGFLVTAFKRWQRLHPDFYLLLVGKIDYFYGRLANEIKNNGITHVVLTGSVSDNDLSALYRHAFAYVFPTLYEGFGLPGLEAQYFGLPVVASANSSLPEILGDGALFFETSNEGQFLRTLERLFDTNLRADLVQKGHNRCKTFDWANTARVTNTLYARSKN